jgi:hypothetical protein
MRAGDLVRFKHVRLPAVVQPVWKIGLLVEYNTWEKVASVLYKGKILRLRPENVQKAGKKDI